MEELKELMGRAFLEAVPQRSEGEAEFLSDIEEDELIREYFLCLVFRMPLEELKKMKEESKSAGDIERLRQEYIVKLATDQDPLVQRMNSELSRIKEEIRENREKSDYLRKDAAESMERERNTLLDRIEDLKAQQKRDQMMIAQYLEDVRNYREQADAYRKKSDEYVQRIDALTSRKETEMVKTLPDKEDDAEIIRRAEKIRENYAVPEEYTGFMERRRQKRRKEEYEQEMDLFMRELLNRKELSKEQRDYLLSALEEGHTFTIVRRVMVPTLTVEQMQKFIRIYERKLGGKHR